ncbi:hypothetical protein CHU95_00385 [Niveispirillum lacus]|uniref:Uncharacterized protein n=1 Tax=Niveispirillum lacus TaxID=1981099 RepID=A0A255Z8C1_9PROT|nr:hypothetical protein CHU95_00385 [Niveispirillum lacus]
MRTLAFHVFCSAPGSVMTVHHTRNKDNLRPDHPARFRLDWIGGGAARSGRRLEDAMTVGLDTFLQGMTDEEWRAVEARTKQLIAGNLFTGRMAGRGRKPGWH